MHSRLTARLERASGAAFTAYAGLAAFGTYFCMYAFRKAFAAARFAEPLLVPWLGAVDAKTLFVIAQVVGYATSKFLGIKIVSELAPARRAAALVGCIAVAQAALVAFAVLPPGWAALAMFANGLPLGLVWGLVFGFVEGRRTSDVLGAILCASFVVASGAVKSVGKVVLDAGVTEAWMPALVGFAFLPLLGGFAWMLAQLPPPSAEDEAARTRRAPMDGPARRAFARAHAGALVPLVIAYVALTALRDFRDAFARELWDALGWASTPSVLAAAEIPVAAVSLLAIALLSRIRSDRRALTWVLVAILGGLVSLALATLAFRAGWVGPATWMMIVGAALYVAYIPYNGVLFDRLVGAVGSVATAGFLIYVCDAFGYAGSVGLLLYRSLGQASLPWVRFLGDASIATAFLGVPLVAFALWRVTRVQRAER